VIKLIIDGNEVRATVGETTFVPAGTIWSFDADSVYAEVYMLAAGEVLWELTMA